MRPSATWPRRFLSERPPDESFQYERASDVSAALTAGARAGAQYLGGGTNLVDLMREAIERPDVLVDVTGLSRDIEETRRRRLEDRRRREEHRRRGRSPCARALSPARPGDPGRRLRADPQHGDGRGQSHAAHPLPLFLRRRRRAATSALPERAATRETASTATTPSSAPLRAASPRTRRTCASPLRLWTLS